MVEIDAVIDNKPTKKLVKEMAMLRIRNLDAFRELKSLNDNGKFLYKHELIKNYSLRVKLENLFQNNPGGFLNEYANTSGNVKRYSSFLKNKKRSLEQKKKDKTNLQKHQEREKLMKDITGQNSSK